MKIKGINNIMHEKSSASQTVNVCYEMKHMNNFVIPLTKMGLQQILEDNNKVQPGKISEPQR